MSDFLNKYAAVAGEDVIQHLQQLAAPLEGLKVVHVNSTRVGGGVAEILDKMVPMMASLGLDVQWEVITGEPDFYQCTKSFHNGLQGMPVDVSLHLRKAYETTNEQLAEQHRELLTEADIVIIHDPQPAPLLKYIPNRKGKWIWRCHIDASRPYRPVWKYLREFVSGYDGSIFSLVNFAQILPHPQT